MAICAIPTNLFLDPLEPAVMAELVVYFGYSEPEIRTLHARGVGTETMRHLARLYACTSQ